MEQTPIPIPISEEIRSTDQNVEQHREQNPLEGQNETTPSTVPVDLTGQTGSDVQSSSQTNLSVPVLPPTQNGELPPTDSATGNLNPPEGEEIFDELADIELGELEESADQELLDLLYKVTPNENLPSTVCILLENFAPPMRNSFRRSSTTFNVVTFKTECSDLLLLSSHRLRDIKDGPIEIANMIFQILRSYRKAET